MLVKRCPFKSFSPCLFVPFLCIDIFMLKRSNFPLLYTRYLQSIYNYKFLPELHLSARSTESVSATFTTVLVKACIRARKTIVNLIVRLRFVS